jgi:hypothetical protein
LADGATQSIAADRLHVSRSFVSQTVTLLIKHNLIKKQHESKYNSFYEISKELLAQLKKEGICEFSHSDTHYIKRKYRILKLDQQLSQDRRTGFMKAWKMRGGYWYKFWYPGKAGEPRIAVDVMGHTIVVYPDKKQSVIATSIDAAEDKIVMSCHNAVLRFIKCQARAGVHIEIDEIGQQITPTHYAFPLSANSPYAKAGTTHPESWTDGSPTQHGEKDRCEYETTDKTRATALDIAIDKVMEVDELVKGSIREAMPTAMKDFEKAFEPMQSSIVRVEAMLQGGITISKQYEQMVNFMTKALDEMADIRRENAELKKMIGATL